MDDTKRNPQPPAQLAKGALRRLMLEKLEPTPENYARAYGAEAAEAGMTAPAGVSDNWPERGQPVLAKLLAIGVSELQARQDLNAMLRAGRWDEALKVLERIHKVMRPHGLLFVGHSENFTESKDLFRLRGKTIYERV